MTIPLSTNPGGVYRRIGLFLGNLNANNTFATGQDAKYATIEAQYQATNQDLADGLFTLRNNVKSDVTNQNRNIAAQCAPTLIRMANDDVPLATKDSPTALRLLFSQMVAAAASVNANTVSVAVTAGTNGGVANTGDTIVNATVKGTDGKNRELVFAETLALAVSNDNQHGVTAGNEPWTLLGTVAETDPLSYNWPKGSAASETGTVVDSLDDATAGNLLTNGHFSNFTSSIPDSWTIISSVPANIAAAGASYGFGTNALKFTGDGADLTSIGQTLTTLEPNTVYAWTLTYKNTVASPATGTLRVSLVDGSNTIITDDNSGSNSSTVALSGVANTSWHQLNGFFITPKSLPATVKFRIDLSVALENAKIAYIANVALCETVEAYTGGPFVGAFRNTIDPLIGDSWNVAVSNDYGGLIQTGFERVFGMRVLGLQIPSNASAAETVSDSLVTT